MVVVIDREQYALPQGLLADVDERAARRSLRRQIARLEEELADTLISAFPRAAVDVHVADAGGPRLLTLGDLELLRDAQMDRLASARAALHQRGEEEAANRLLLEQMFLAPGKHKFERITMRDVGGHGCGVYHVRPRLGVIGMLAGWWHVKLSSGCPLATA